MNLDLSRFLYLLPCSAHIFTHKCGILSLVSTQSVGTRANVALRLGAFTLTLFTSVTLMVSQGVNAAAQPPSKSPLPDRLTLEQALALADESHPDLLVAKAGVDDARANLMVTESQTGFNSFLDLTARRTKLSINGEDTNDSYARLVLNKTLYDFGRSSALETSYTALIGSTEYRLSNARLGQQYEIMRRFFDVILADFRYTVDDEEMTQRFLKFDKLRERQTLGMVSDVKVLKAASHYREALDQRVASDRNRRSARVMLAVALNHPMDLPGELVLPEFIGLGIEPPDPEKLYQEAVSKNQTILALRQETEAARTRIQAERARAYPVLSAEVEVADYAYETGTRGDYSAALMLRVPIYQGGIKKAEVARASASLSRLGAQLKKAEQELLVTITQLVKDLEVLKSSRETAKQRIAYRDLDLDYRRALYEMEVQTSMSDALARITEAQWLSMKTDIDIALTWAKLNILLGKPPNTPIADLPKLQPEETLP